MKLLVVDERGINGPIHSSDRSRRQLGFQFSSLADKGKTIAGFYERLQLSGVRCPRKFLDLDSGFPEEFQKPGVGIGMSLRVIEDPKIILQVRRQHSGLFGKWMVSAETRYEPIPANRLHT